MKAVAEREIDDSVSSPKGYGGFGSLVGQRMQSGTHSACQDNADRLSEHTALPIRRVSTDSTSDAICCNVAIKRIELLTHILNSLVK